jgi:sugar O-acyltransferase (sialic acid O-acetyltransferase NeuD family)
VSLGATNKRKLVVCGASGHALVVSDIIRLAGKYEVVAFFDNQNEPPPGSAFQGVPLLSNMEQLRELKKQGTKNCILAFGHCGARLRLAQDVRAEGFKLVIAVHPAAIVAQDVLIGEGTVIVAGVVINPGCTVGENVIVNTSASVDHECVIEDGAHVGPGAHLGGKVRVGRAAWVGIGATVRDRVRIGANSIVGAGSVVLRDVPADTVVVGVPAKAIRNVKPDEN